MPDLSRRLSPNFTLGELCRTSNRNFDNTPTKDVELYLEKLSNELLEPIRSKFGPLHVNSGYRSPDINAAVGGSKTSAHMYGCAADVVTHSVKLQTIFNWIIDHSGLNYDQIILESSSTSNWLHIAIAKPGKLPRKEALRFSKGKYTPYDKTIDYGV